MEPYRYCVTFRISHPKIEPSEISSQLGIEASSSWKAGDPIVGKNGEIREGKRKENFWRYQPHREHRLLSSEQYFEDYIEMFTKKLIIHKKYFSEIINSGGKINYFIGLFSGNSIGNDFPATLLKQLGELNIDLQLDIYAYDE